MDVSQLPNVHDLLVTADNPARTDLQEWIIHYAWVAEGRTPASLPRNSTLFTTYGAAAEALRPRLQPSLAAFLNSAILPPEPFVFFWADAFPEPHNLSDNHMADLFDQSEDSLVCLYGSIIGGPESPGGGLFYHQVHHRAAAFTHMGRFRLCNAR